MGVKINKPERIDAKTRARIVFAYWTRDWDWDATPREAERMNLLGDPRWHDAMQVRLLVGLAP